MTANRLAIVIPAYRARFLAAALESVGAQTDQNFNLYIFDDASPEAVAPVVEKFKARRQLSFHRFEKNLGGSSLAQHWARCVEKTSEPWVWLFSDDDEMEPDCVATFFRELEKTGGRHALYRFNTRCIDEQSRIIAENEPYPLEETGADFLLARLRGERGSTMQELIFSRAAWKNSGGFPDFPLAWAADDAFIAGLGEKISIRHLAGPRVRWRLSEGNLTGQNSIALLPKKLAASKMFLAWAKNFLAENSAGNFDGKNFDRLAQTWFFNNLFYRRKFLDWETCELADAFAREVWRRPTGWGAAKCLAQNARRFFGAAGRRLKLK